MLLFQEFVLYTFSRFYLDLNFSGLDFFCYLLSLDFSGLFPIHPFSTLPLVLCRFPLQHYKPFQRCLKLHCCSRSIFSPRLSLSGLDFLWTWFFLLSTFSGLFRVVSYPSFLCPSIGPLQISASALWTLPEVSRTPLLLPVHLFSTFPAHESRGVYFFLFV